MAIPESNPLDAASSLESSPERMERLRRQMAVARAKINPEKQRARGLASAARLSQYKETPGFEEKRKAGRLRFVHSDAGRAIVQKWMSMPGHRAGPGHVNEKVWSVRDPAGRLHRFRNLCEFVRNNQALFASEDVVPQMKGMATRWDRTRAYDGLASLRPSAGKTPSPGSWKGWTWATIYERAIANGADLLSRWPNTQLSNGGTSATQNHEKDKT